MPMLSTALCINYQFNPTNKNIFQKYLIKVYEEIILNKNKCMNNGDGWI